VTLSLYEVSIPALIRGLENLSMQIDKAVAFVRDNDIDEGELVHARLAPDMLDFAGQVQRASDTAKFGGARLSQGQAPGFADEETTLDELKARIARTVDYLQGITAADIDGGEQRAIAFKAGQRELRFTAQDYVCSFLLPNLYFHLATAYGILRQKGVALGKLDYLGKIQ
jgi:hypothetical protein